MEPATHSPERPVRVALSNDYEIALLGLAAMLARHPDQVQIVDITTNPNAMLHEPDVILFDTFGRLPGEDAKLRRMVAENDAKVVVYSWDDYPEDAARQAGAAGYLHKSMSAPELVGAIVALHSGEQVPVAGGDDAPTQTWPGQAAGLSEREAEMLSFIVRGLTNGDIARRSYLSINTVKTYIRTAYRKIGATNRAQAVAWGFRNGFDSTDDTGV
ncbi:response regulator transcription factor [Nocardioides sp. SR21]|uniref:response regulator transcription factor n=1 Tax=Nocardioides sp. SR21 TaxID=2919501 RepID=UPI001FA96198|nr:response regulator transcription factor [Nocardioides sp. SR21]